MAGTRGWTTLDARPGPVVAYEVGDTGGLFVRASELIRVGSDNDPAGETLSLTLAGLLVTISAHGLPPRSGTAHGSEQQSA